MVKEVPTRGFFKPVNCQVQLPDDPDIITSTKGAWGWCPYWTQS